jgi:lysozyme family protein
MADVNKLVPHILKWEGGFVNDPDDLGGATNKGVTFKTYKLYRNRKGLPIPSVGDLKRLSNDEFTDILKTMFWDACRSDEISSQSVANAIVDWAWHSGTTTAAKEIQRVLGVKADGIIGNITLSAINSQSPLPLFGKIKAARVKYIERICKSRPENQKYYRGWMNRINDLQYEE